METKKKLDLNGFMKEINKIKKTSGVDLSSDEDLSIALMNLISIEEHLYFSGMKTGKKEYFTLLNTVRGYRKDLLKELVKEPEGEVWCISKHLLAASMRLIEVGTKYLSKNMEKEANEKFKVAFDLYSMFWALNLKLGGIPKGQPSPDMAKEYKPNESWAGKVPEIIKKILDCCKE